MMSSNEFFSLKKQKKSPLELLKFYKFAEQLTTYVSINQDCIKSAKAETFSTL